MQLLNSFVIVLPSNFYNFSSIPYWRSTMQYTCIKRGSQHTAAAEQTRSLTSSWAVTSSTRHTSRWYQNLKTTDLRLPESNLPNAFHAWISPSLSDLEYDQTPWVWSDSCCFMWGEKHLLPGGGWWAGEGVHSPAAWRSGRDAGPYPALPRLLPHSCLSHIIPGTCVSSNTVWPEW